jgi:hypothetical protein
VVSAVATDAFGNTSTVAMRSFDVATVGKAVGDVHLTTFRGQRYDFQATGEFVLVASTDPARAFEVQVQESEWRGMASVTTEVAARIGDAAVVFRTDGSVSLNGVIDANAATPGYKLAFDGGTFTRLSASASEIDWSGGERLSINNTNLGWFDLAMSLGPDDGANSVKGLLGRNANIGSDFSMPDGTIISQKLSYDELTGFYADAWRVSPDDSLFAGAAPALNAAFANSPAVLSSGLAAQRTSFKDRSFEIATTGIVGEPYDSSYAFYTRNSEIETELFVKDGAAYKIENWNPDGSVRDVALLGESGAPFGNASAVDLRAFSENAALTFHEDASGAYGLLNVSEGAKALTLQLQGNYEASDFLLAGDASGGALLIYHTVSG